MKKVFNIFLFLLLGFSGCIDRIFEEGPENYNMRFFGTPGKDLGIDVLIQSNEYFVLGSITSGGFSLPAIYSLNHQSSQKEQPIIINNETDNLVIDFVYSKDDGYYVLTNSLPEQAVSNSRVHLMKVSGDGMLQWQKDFGEGKSISSKKMLVHNDRIYLIGGVSGAAGSKEDGWMLVLSLDGEVVKEVVFGGALNDRLVSLIPFENDLILFGSTQSFDTGNKSGDLWLIRTDRAGSIKGFNTFGTAGVDIAIDVIEHDNGNAIAVLGRSAKSLDGGYTTYLSCVDPASLSVNWNKNYSKDYSLSPQSVVSRNNSLVVVQNEEISSNFTRVGFLEYDMDGTLLDNYILNGGTGITCKKLVSLDNNQLILVGSNVFRGNSDIAFIKLDENAGFY